MERLDAMHGNISTSGDKRKARERLSVVVASSSSQNDANLPSDVRWRRGFVAIGKTAEQCFWRYAIDIAWLVPVVGGDG